MRQFFKTNISKSDPGNSDGFQLPMLRNASGFSHQVDKMDFIFGVFFFVGHTDMEEQTQ